MEWNRRSEPDVFTGKEVRLLTILYKKHSLAILRSALRVVSPVESSNWRYAADHFLQQRASGQTFEQIPVPLGL